MGIFCSKYQILNCLDNYRAKQSHPNKITRINLQGSAGITALTFPAALGMLSQHPPNPSLQNPILTGIANIAISPVPEPVPQTGEFYKGLTRFFELHQWNIFQIFSQNQPEQSLFVIPTEQAEELRLFLELF